MIGRPPYSRSHPIAEAAEQIGAHHATVYLFRTLEERIESLPSPRQLARELDYSPNALVSRLLRADLPSPATILRRLRYIYLRRLLGAHPEMTCEALALHTGWSSESALVRHLNVMFGIPYRRWRGLRTEAEEIEWFIAEIIASPSYAPRWRTFRLFDDRVAA